MQRPPVRSPRSVPRTAAVAAAASLAVGATVIASVSAPAGAAPGDTTVQILSFNDYHGHVESDTPGSIDGSFGGPAAGGGEFLSAKLTELRDASDADASFTVAAGDLIGGSPFFSGLFHDEPSVESLNVMELDFSGVGNHEFDEGVDELLRMQNGGNHPVDGGYFDGEVFAGADFQWLAANVTEDAPDGTDDFAESIPPYKIETISTDDGDKKIAFIGMTLEGTPELVAAVGIAGFSFGDEVASAAAAADAIQAEDPDVEAMVVMLHEGGIPSPFAINGCAGISGPIVDIAEDMDPRIDAIVTGHTHQPYTCTIDDPDSNPRPVVSAFSFGRVVTEINLEIGDDGDVDRTTFTMVNHEVLQDDLTPDPAVTAILDRWAPLAEDIGDSPIGMITETITRGGEPSGDDRGVESAAGNLVADAQLAATADDFGAVLALMNPGGVRSDLIFESSDAGEGDGVVTFGEAFTFQPFNNTLYVLPMTGAQIISVLEEQCQPGDSSRPVLHLGVSEGFTYDLNITQQDGVCTGVEVTNVMLNGTALDEAATYNVTTNGFLADGGDNFDTFAEVAVTDRLPGPQDIDALKDYFANASGPIEPPSTDRVNETGSVLPTSVSALEPARLLETRTGENNVTVDGEFQGQGRVAAGGEVELQVTERGNVPSGAAAVVLNVGIVAPSGPGFATIYPCGTERPQASSVNYGDATASNAVYAKVSDEGTVCIYTSAEAHIIADVLSTVPADGSPVPVDPARLLETRTGEANTTVDGRFQRIGEILGGSELELLVRTRGGIAGDAEAVVLNVGAVNPSDAGFFTVYPCGTTRPQASSLNFAAGETVSNSVTVSLPADGSVCIYSSVTTHAIADASAYVPTGSALGGVGPARLLETRTGPGAITADGEFQGDGPIAAEGVVMLDVAGRDVVPGDVSTVVLNVGAVRPAAPGFITVYDCSGDRPGASNVNYAGGDVVSNSVIAEVGDDGTVCVYTSAQTDIIVDVTAVVSPPVPARPAE